MKKLVIAIALMSLVAVLDLYFGLDLSPKAYVVPGFLVGASVLELSQSQAKEAKRERKAQFPSRAEEVMICGQ